MSAVGMVKVPKVKRAKPAVKKEKDGNKVPKSKIAKAAKKEKQQGAPKVKKAKPAAPAVAGGVTKKKKKKSTNGVGMLALVKSLKAAADAATLLFDKQKSK